MRPSFYLLLSFLVTVVLTEEKTVTVGGVSNEGLDFFICGS